MLVRALKEYAETYLGEQISDPAFELQKVEWLIEIDNDGRFLGLVQTEGTKQERRGKTVALAREYRIPKPAGARSSATTSSPLPAVDSCAYVLGPGEWTKAGQEPKEQRHHEAFVALLEEIAERTGDAGAIACVRFYRRGELDKLRADLAGRKWRPGGDRFAFALAGQPVFEREAVKEFWRQLFAAARSAGKRKREAICLCCGQKRPFVPSHDKIKRVPGGQPSGVALMSFDKAAYRSMGWEKSENSPTCESCQVAYTRALNHLLRRDNSPPTRLDIGGTAFLFWTRQPADHDVATLLTQPHPGQVQALLEAVRRGRPSGPIDTNAFYCLALRGNGGRAVVREWIETLLPDAEVNLARWFEDLQIVLEWDIKQDGQITALAGDMSPPVGIGRLCNTTVRDVKEPNPRLASALVKSALAGRPLPDFVLGQALARMRAGNADPRRGYRFPFERMALIRCALNRRLRSKGDKEMSPGLDATRTDGAYLCGRLLAALERLQYLAVGDVGATIIDRFYGTASTAPRAVFPRLVKLAQSHLGKLKSDKAGAAVNAQKDLEAIMGYLDEFPAVLTLEEQGVFALGFYHQRAAYRAKRSADATDTADSVDISAE